MGNDRLGFIDGMLQIPQHAIRADRRVARRKFRHPFGKPGGFDRGDLRVRARRVARGAVEKLAAGIDERAQGELRVAGETDLRTYRLVQVVGIAREMNDRFALRHFHRERVLGEAAAGAENNVGIIEEVAHGFRHRGTARAERERMRLIKGALALEARAHGRPQ